nr:bacillithiol biosynthesis deacetylase BshB1 [Candidatus Sigynarchaeota archaeon]
MQVGKITNVDILVIGAHPDDAEIGCGGTISHYIKAGKRVGILDCSNGEPTPHGTIEKRLNEALRAAEVLGLTMRVTLDMKNRYIENSIGNRVKIADVIRQSRPRIIITHPGTDWHPDHVAVHQLVNAAKFHAKLTKTESPHAEFSPGRVVYFDHSHIKEQRRCDFLVDISESLEEKIHALQCYESQFIENKKNMKIFEYVRERAGFLGFQVGVRYAEAFICPEYFLVDDVTRII